MSYYLSTGDDTPVEVNLHGVTRDPLKDIHKCYLKLHSNVITGIILDRDWVEQKNTVSWLFCEWSVIHSFVYKYVEVKILHNISWRLRIFEEIEIYTII